MACVTSGPTNGAPCTPPSRLHARLPLTLFVPPHPEREEEVGGVMVVVGVGRGCEEGGFVVHSVWGNTAGETGILNTQLAPRRAPEMSVTRGGDARKKKDRKKNQNVLISHSGRKKVKKKMR